VLILSGFLFSVSTCFVHVYVLLGFFFCEFFLGGVSLCIFILFYFIGFSVARYIFLGFFFLFWFMCKMGSKRGLCLFVCSFVCVEIAS
jgi:hypothetical protein